MRSRVDQAALVHDEDAVRAHGRGDALRHDELRAAVDGFGQCGAQRLFRQEIKRGEAVVIDLDGRFFDDGPRDGQTLLLTAGEVFARLPDLVGQAALA